MTEERCSSQQAEFYTNDLFEYLDLKGNNQLLFNQICSLLIKHSNATIKKSWKDIVYSCEPPNGQMAGRLPKLHFIEQILLNNRVDKYNYEHKQTKKEIGKPGLINNLWQWGLDLRDGKITQEELDKKIEEYNG